MSVKSELDINRKVYLLSRKNIKNMVFRGKLTFHYQKVMQAIG